MLTGPGNTACPRSCIGSSSSNTVTTVSPFPDPCMQPTHKGFGEVSGRVRVVQPPGGSGTCSQANCGSVRYVYMHCVRGGCQGENYRSTCAKQCHTPPSTPVQVSRLAFCVHRPCSRWRVDIICRWGWGGWCRTARVTLRTLQAHRLHTFDSASSSEERWQPVTSAVQRRSSRQHGCKSGAESDHGSHPGELHGCTWPMSYPHSVCMHAHVHHLHGCTWPMSRLHSMCMHAHGCTCWTLLGVRCGPRA